MNWAEYIFWICLLLAAYTYFLYPVLLFLAYVLAQARRDWRYLGTRRNRRAIHLSDDQAPAISLIVPAHNEESSLPAKLANLRQLDYPRERLEIIFVSDGSTDRTNSVLKGFSGRNFHSVFLPKRVGKSTALNHGVARARHDILVFSDTPTLFSEDALRKLGRHFSDPRIGVVCGSLEFQRNEESRQTEGFYWKYESVLRLMEARLGATLTASGAMYAVRRQCYLPLSPSVLIDDFIIPMNARKLGYRVLYDPEAAATDLAGGSVEDEFFRRVRLAVGSFRALGQLSRVPLDGFTALAFLSHKVLRWVLPLPLLGLLLSSLFVLDDPFYQAVFVGQIVFYLLAWLGLVFRAPMQRLRYGLVSYFFVAMNLAFLTGFARYLFGDKEVGWQPVDRVWRHS